VRVQTHLLTFGFLFLPVNGKTVNFDFDVADMACYFGV
jgi:hypothetical protein